METRFLFTPRQMRMLFDLYKIEPTKSVEVDSGHAYAWILPGGNYLIEINDFTGTWYDYHPNADGMERWIERPISSPCNDKC